ETSIKAHPESVMVAGQVVVIDEEGKWRSMTAPLSSDRAALVGDFAQRQAFRQLCQFAGVVVRRAAYEKVGGFCTYFDHVADWDMWFRVGSIGPVATVERPFGLYRTHTASDTSKLIVTAANTREIFLYTEVNLRRLGIAGTRRASALRSRLACDAET